MSMADIAERMFALYAPQLSMATIVRVVQRCCRELEMPASPLPTATLESMAQQRLARLARLGGIPSP
jgi:hypothetical protein